MILKLTAASAVALAALALGGAPAGAQTAASSCPVDTDKPGQLKTAKNALGARDRRDRRRQQVGMAKL